MKIISSKKYKEIKLIKLANELAEIIHCCNENDIDMIYNNCKKYD